MIRELAKPLPQHEYSLVKRNILCYCLIQIGYTTVPQTISDCNATAFPTFYSTVNLGFWTDLMSLFNDTNYKIPLSLTSKDYVLPVSLTDYSQDMSFAAFMQKHNKHASLQPTNTAELKATIAEYRNFTQYRKKLFNEKGRDNVTVSVLAPLKKSSFLYTTVFACISFHWQYNWNSACNSKCDSGHKDEKDKCFDGSISYLSTTSTGLLILTKCDMYTPLFGAVYISYNHSRYSGIFVQELQTSNLVQRIQV